MKLKRGFDDLRDSLGNVFGNWKYSALAVFIFLAFYFLNVIFSNFDSLSSFSRENGFFSGVLLFFNLSFGFYHTLKTNSFVSLLIIGVLFGILFSMIMYKTNMLKGVSGKIGILGTIGIFLGIIAPGCAACGLGLLSFLGLGAVAATFLPFEGLEVSWLAIAILGFSIHKISKDIKKGIICEIDSHHSGKTNSVKGGKRNGRRKHNNNKER